MQTCKYCIKHISNRLAQLSTCKDLRKELSASQEFLIRESPSGKEFFIFAKQRLNPNDFKEFMQTMKRFNSKEIDREQAIENAKIIFGVENEDLLILFSQVIES